MAYLAKMAYLQLATNMANIRQSLNKICNEMANEEAKGLLKSGEYDENGEKSQRRFWRRWEICRKWLRFAKALYRSHEIDEFGENAQRVNL